MTQYGQPAYPPPPKRSRVPVILAIVAVGLVVLTVAGAGAYLGFDAYQQAQDEERRAASAAAESEAAQAEQAAIEECADAVGGYVGKLRDITSRYQGVGINLETFEEMLGSVADLRGRIEVTDLTTECESVVDVADVASGQYAQAQDEWHACVWDDSDCDVDALDLSTYFDPARRASDEAWDALREGREASDVGLPSYDG